MSDFTDRRRVAIFREALARLAAIAFADYRYMIWDDVLTPYGSVVLTVWPDEGSPVSQRWALLLPARAAVPPEDLARIGIEDILAALERSPE